MTNPEGLTNPQRLRQILTYMEVPREKVQTLDLPWLAENLSTSYSHKPHYMEARQIIIEMLEVNSHGKSKRLR